MVARIVEPAWRRSRIALTAIFVLVTALHVMPHLFSARIHELSNGVVRDALIWIGDHL